MIGMSILVPSTSRHHVVNLRIHLGGVNFKAVSGKGLLQRFWDTEFLPDDPDPEFNTPDVNEVVSLRIFLVANGRVDLNQCLDQVIQEGSELESSESNEPVVAIIRNPTINDS